MNTASHALHTAPFRNGVRRICRGRRKFCRFCALPNLTLKPTNKTVIGKRVSAEGTSTPVRFDYSAGQAPLGIVPDSAASGTLSRFNRGISSIAMMNTAMPVPVIRIP